jgi:hypothetical protein
VGTFEKCFDIRNPGEVQMSTTPVVIHKSRTNTLHVSINEDVSADTFTSEIRDRPDVGANLLATWVVAFVNDGTDGELILTLDNTATAQIDSDRGYMDIKRMSGGEPISLFERPLDVEFRGSVTA